MYAFLPDASRSLSYPCFLMKCNPGFMMPSQLACPAHTTEHAELPQTEIDEASPGSE